jgi:voltage-gated potassium channel
MTENIKNRIQKPFGQGVLLLLCVLYVFIIPLFSPEVAYVASLATLSLIFYSSALSVEIGRKIFLIFASATFITELVSQLLNWDILLFFTRVTSNVFLIVIVFKFILQIANQKDVNLKSILEVMNGYFLLGIVYLSLVIFIARMMPGAYRHISAELPLLSDFVYFTFITLTTVGYGDITPALPITKMLSVVIAVSGQFYVAVIIAIIVGKVNSNRS